MKIVQRRARKMLPTALLCGLVAGVCFAAGYFGVGLLAVRDLHAPAPEPVVLEARTESPGASEGTGR